LRNCRPPQKMSQTEEDIAIYQYFICRNGQRLLL
jgi:hypothetical protein